MMWRFMMNENAATQIDLSMPYTWITPATDDDGELHLWPHQSLPVTGYVNILAMAAVLICVPLLPVLGSVILWGVLPFLLAALFGLKWALDHNRRDQQILEILTLDSETARLIRNSPHQEEQSWNCNRYWTSVQLHKKGGPVPNYVTLRGNGREVEIGAFLSENERKSLYQELATSLPAHGPPPATPSNEL